MVKNIFVTCSIFALAACGSSEPEEEKVDYAAFDDAAIQALIEQGEQQQAIEILKGQEELGIANKQDYLAQAQIYDERFDGVAAEVAVEKAREQGATVQETALLLARGFLAQKKYEEALGALGEIEEESGNTHEWHLLRADIASGEEEPEVARQYFTSALEIKPEDSAGYIGLAVLELEQGNFEQADSFAIQAASYADNDPLVDYVRGAVARNQQRHEEAVVFLERATARIDGHAPAHLELAGTLIELGRLDDARIQLDAAFLVEPRNPMTVYYAGLIAAMEGKQKEAEELLLRTGDLIKRYPPAARTYAHVEYALNKCENAQPYFERFLSVQPEDKKSVLAFADCLARLNKPEQALALLQRILNENPDDLDASIQAAGAAGQLENTVAAKTIIERAYKRALVSEGFNQQMLGILGRRLAFMEFVTGNYEGAEVLLSKLSKEHSGNEETYALLANIHMKKGDLVKAEEAVQTILSQDAKSAQGLNLLGAIRYRERNLPEAELLFTQALAEVPDYQSALKNRALAYIGLGKFAEAEADLQPLVEKAPTDGQLQGLLGRVFIETGKPNDALPLLKRAERALPKSAIIATDHALAMAQSGFVASAIAQAQKAKKLAEADKGLSSYLDNLIANWEQKETDRRALEAAEEAQAKEAFKKEQEERRKAREKKAQEQDDDTPDGR